MRRARQQRLPVIPPLEYGTPSLTCSEVERNFGGIGDPLFESVRFYTCDRVGGSFSPNQVTEPAVEKVNEIEGLLMQTEEAVPLFAPLLTKLKTIAPEFIAFSETHFRKALHATPSAMSFGNLGGFLFCRKGTEKQREHRMNQSLPLLHLCLSRITNQLFV